MTTTAAEPRYWLAQENWAGISKELYRMGLRAYNRQIREQLISEARAEGRQEILDELRAKTPEEIRQILEQADHPGGGHSDCG